MLRWSRWARDDEGSAALEFIVVGVILLVPLVYLVLALGVIQEQTLGVEAAARHTARVIGMAPDAQTAAERGDAVLANVVEEYGLDPESVRVSLSCTPAADPCPAPGATAIVTVATTAGLPFVPPVFGLDEATSIPLQADAAQKVSRLWGTG
ncbi:TadE family protein [Microbacterium tumbae]